MLAVLRFLWQRASTAALRYYCKQMLKLCTFIPDRDPNSPLSVQMMPVAVSDTGPDVPCSFLSAATVLQVRCLPH
jgi:hypothetical protein